MIKEKHIRDFDKWLLNTAPPNADSTIISFIIFAEKRWLLSLILFLYNRLTSKCYSMALVWFSLHFVKFVTTMSWAAIQLRKPNFKLPHGKRTSINNKTRQTWLNQVVLIIKTCFHHGISPVSSKGRKLERQTVLRRFCQERIQTTEELCKIVLLLILEVISFLMVEQLISIFFLFTIEIYLVLSEGEFKK